MIFCGRHVIVAYGFGKETKKPKKSFLSDTAMPWSTFLYHPQTAHGSKKQTNNPKNKKKLPVDFGK